MLTTEALTKDANGGAVRVYSNIKCPGDFCLVREWASEDDVVSIRFKTPEDARRVAELIAELLDAGGSLIPVTSVEDDGA